MITALVILGYILVGLFYAPRNAAIAYRHSGMSTETYKMVDAKMGLVLGFLIWPVSMFWYFCRIYVFGAVGIAGNNTVTKALIKHDPKYRAKHVAEVAKTNAKKLSDLERRNATLEAENARLTAQVLGS